MMRVDLKPEPPVFEERVRKKGQKYLKKVPSPTTKQWTTHDYWTDVKFDLHEAYCGICNFVCHWIPPDTGSITVEHYRPKAKYPADAYEWANYRLMCGTLNGRKSDYEDVLDPIRNH
jgi:5-methylcytosine-specific restriction endonuclease McrA